jgi:hypothetical protein
VYEERWGIRNYFSGADKKQQKTKKNNGIFFARKFTNKKYKYSAILSHMAEELVMKYASIYLVSFVINARSGFPSVREVFMIQYLRVYVRK